MAEDSTTSGRPSRSSTRIGVTSSPEIAFPAPAPPLPSSASRPKRGAAQAAAASILEAASTSQIDQDGSPTSSVEDNDHSEEHQAEGGAPSLTNGDSDYDDASSMIIDGKMGETDEWTMDEYEYSATGKYKDELTDEDDLAMPQTTSKRKASTSSPAKSKRVTKAAKVQVKDEEDGTTVIDFAMPAEDTQDTENVKPKRKAKSKAAKAVKEATDAILANVNGENGTQSGGESDLTDLDAEEVKPKKARKPRKPREPKPEPVYVIPEVEKLPNDQEYKGRLGYACLNTILRNKKPPIFCSRTCRIDTIKKNGMEFLKELGRTNILDLATLIQWNEDNVSFFISLFSPFLLS